MICTKCGHEKSDVARRGLCKSCWATARLRHGWESKYVDARPVRSHVLILQAAGLGTRRISALSGVGRKQITALIHGRSDRNTGPSKRVLNATATKLLAVRIPKERHELAADHTPVLATGAMRRLQALVAIGYTQSYLAERIGMDPTNATPLIHGRQVCVSARRARLVAALYDELSTMPPADELGWADRNRKRARKLGWSDPFAWEDVDLDNPDARPAPTPPKGRPTTRKQRYWELVELGGITQRDMARRLGIDEVSLIKWLRVNGLDRRRRDESA